MEFGKNSLGGRRAAFVVVIAAALAFGCAGKSERSSSDDGAGTGTGGTGAANGGAANGGTATALATCVSFCERQERCPGNEPVDCESNCPDAYELVARCKLELFDHFVCLSTVSDICNLDGVCVNEVEAFEACLEGR